MMVKNAIKMELCQKMYELGSRSLHGKNGRTIITGAKTIMDYASALQDKVREGDKSTILPLIAYYGTGRLYMQKRQARKSNSDTKFTRTSGQRL